MSRSRHAGVSPAAASDAAASELAADRLVLIVGLSIAVAGLAWLVARIVPTATASEAAVVVVYAAGCIVMFATSAAYNLAPPGRAKRVLRRFDHAAIFVMIAGSYTPFALRVLEPGIGVPFCVVVWGFALCGAGLKLAAVDWDDRIYLALYLALGWSLLTVARPFLAGLTTETLVLLLAGGIVYSLGSMVHARGRMRFHRALWHGMVLVAAGLHFAAVARLFGAG